MTNCYSHITDGRETFSEQQIKNISKSISEAVEKEIVNQSKTLSSVFQDSSKSCNRKKL